MQQNHGCYTVCGQFFYFAGAQKRNHETRVCLSNNYLLDIYVQYIMMMEMSNILSD